MKSPEKNALTAIVYGMDNRSREALRMAFDGLGKGCCLLNDDAAADVAIINMDSVSSSEVLQKIRGEHPQQHIIVLSVNDPQIENTLYVARPIRMDAMINVINQVRQLPPLEPRPITPITTPESGRENETAIVSPNNIEYVEVPSDAISNPSQASQVSPTKRIRIPKVDFSKQEQQDTYCYDPSNYLQGQITKAIERATKKNTAVQISIKVGREWKTITFLPEAKKVLTSISKTWLKQLCTTPICTLEVKTRLHNKKNSLDLEYRATEKKVGISIEQYLWCVALWTSQGRVPIATNFNTPVYLKHWPNFTRLTPSPNAMRVVTLLIKQPRELPFISQVLGIPYSNVFSLYSAANAIGLAGPAHRDADTLIQSEAPKPHRLHGLFGKILDKLKG